MINDIENDEEKLTDIILVWLELPWRIKWTLLLITGGWRWEKIYVSCLLYACILTHVYVEGGRVGVIGVGVVLLVIVIVGSILMTVLLKTVIDDLHYY